MKNKDIQKLKNGIYRIYFNDGSNTIASVGSLYNGDKWFACVNWVPSEQESVTSTEWSIVQKVVLLDPQVPNMMENLKFIMEMQYLKGKNVELLEELRELKKQSPSYELFNKPFRRAKTRKDVILDANGKYCFRLNKGQFSDELIDKILNSINR